jgi:hypothetical protein
LAAHAREEDHSVIPVAVLQEEAWVASTKRALAAVHRLVADPLTSWSVGVGHRLVVEEPLTIPMVGVDHSLVAEDPLTSLSVAVELHSAMAAVEEPKPN